MKVTKLLVELHSATRKEVPNNWKGRLIKPIITKFINSYGPVLEPDLIKTTAKLLNEIELTHTVCMHGDFCHWNILIKPDGKLAIIDWEHSLIQGFPVIDLTFFFTHSIFELTNAQEFNTHLAYYRDIMNETTHIGSVYKDCVNYYCDRVRIPVASIPIFQLLLLVIMLNRYYDTFTILEKGTPKNETLQNILELDLWKEEIKRLSYS